VNTKVRMTVLNGCVAQSQRAHDTTCLRGMTFPSCRSSPTAAMAPVLAMVGTDLVLAGGSSGVCAFMLRA
jgi:hypothetical protein